MIHVKVVKIQLLPNSVEYISSLKYRIHNHKQHDPLLSVAIQTQKYEDNLWIVVVGIRDVNSITTHNPFHVPIPITRYNVGLISSTQSSSLTYQFYYLRPVNQLTKIS